jgi:structural maintenance of chromosome 4
LEASILKGTFELEKAELQIETLENYLSALQKDADELYNAKEASKLEAKNKLDELEEVKEAHDELKNQHVKLQTQEIELKSKAEDIERVLQDFSHRLKNYEFKMNQAMQSIREVEDELGDELAISIEDAQMDEQRTVRFELLPSEDLDVLAIDDLKYEMAMLEEAISKMDPNMSAIAEYRKKNEEYRDRQKDLDDLNVEREKVRGDHDALRKRRLDEFMNGFSVITMKLKEMYQMLTLGGDAELELVDSLDPFAEGIVFSVRPPKKSWKNISNLSGGEKTLSSLALVFSLHYYKPTPLYVMDEIDAALDFKNVSIVANYIKERTQNAQFIIISLRNNMFELGDRLVGIYKTSNISNSITINPRKIHVQANQKDTPADTFKGGETMTA